MQINLRDVLDTIVFDSLDVFIESLYEKIGIPIALFDNNGEIITISNNAKPCKCSFMKFNKESPFCSLFAPYFISDILKKNIVDKICDNHSRISTKIIEHKGNIYHLTLYQYLLEADVITVNANNVDIIDKSLEKKYHWMPTIFTIEQRDMLFDYIADKIIDLLD